MKTHYIQQYHKLWNYVFYLYHLGQQRQKTGLEQIIEMKCCNEDVTWIPSAAAENDEIEEKIA